MYPSCRATRSNPMGSLPEPRTVERLRGRNDTPALAAIFHRNAPKKNLAPKETGRRKLTCIPSANVLPQCSQLRLKLWRPLQPHLSVSDNVRFHGASRSKLRHSNRRLRHGEATEPANRRDSPKRPNITAQTTVPF